MGVMRHYSYSAGPVTIRKAAKQKHEGIPRESVPKTMTSLDVLLSIWIAESLLENEARPKKRVRKTSVRA
ncbi:MAG TPA: hypothetical protein VK881_11300 [bacterium]|nr:hypothetical protein [bacterium]